MEIIEASLLGCSPHFDVLSSFSDVLSDVSLQDIKIYNSSNANLLIDLFGGAQVENVELVNVTSKMSPALSFWKVATVSVKNIYGRNISGSVVSLEQVLSQNLENLTFYNVSNSQKYSQNLILLTRYSNVTTLGLRPNIDESTVIAGFFIDVYKMGS